MSLRASLAVLACSFWGALLRGQEPGPPPTPVGTTDLDSPANAEKKMVICEAIEWLAELGGPDALMPALELLCLKEAGQLKINDGLRAGDHALTLADEQSTGGGSTTKTWDERFWNDTIVNGGDFTVPTPPSGTIYHPVTPAPGGDTVDVFPRPDIGGPDPVPPSVRCAALASLLLHELIHCFQDRTSVKSTAHS